ncbi:hypothetical protein [Levilactobacillus acidifarinae]|uniref:Uncharacterized protein n=1 Tax=Levilactobacillus acidifarinae DSM 19394 = JCM 15949 TaxID=1423715 RepID=A0A0R1LTH9_9LACO|nr:hypothetical protein [Levilactobacillus acidifarinae]KRK94759.1 hypothetical protein FD25_GL000734 [Levilactobacillus acidifarinae DSM 19394]GEO68517.1 hypothetical protein LAC03_04270 [Levilactobacillus acidifarinae]
MRLSPTALLMGLGLSCLLVGLSGCQPKAQQSSTSFKNASSSSHRYQAKKPAAAVSQSSSQKFKQDFHPTKAQTKSHHYVKSGALTQTGQYTYDSVGTKLTLAQVQHPQTTLKSGPFTYRLTTVRLIRNVAETADAKKMAAQALNLNTVKSPYYTLQVKFTIINHRHQDLTTDGIKGIRLGTQTDAPLLTAATQLSDASAGKTVPANSRLNTYATGLASQGTAPTFKRIKIAFAGAYTATQKQVVAPSAWLTTKIE